MKDRKDPATGPEATPPASPQPKRSRKRGAIYRKASAGGTLEAAGASAAVDRAEEGSGGAMAGTVRSSMESRFGQSFADVRIHQDAPAAEGAEGLNARAFTVGSDVYFNKGAYQPDSESGTHLLAHELAHVAQQGDGVAAKADGGISVSSPSDSAERAADAAADAVVRGDKVGELGTRPASVIHRDGIGDLNEAVEGNWLLGASKSDVKGRISDLSEAEARRFATAPAQAGLRRRVCGVLNTPADLMWLFAEVPYFTLDRKLQLIAGANQLAAISSTQWDRIITDATAAELTTLPSKISATNAIADTKATPGALMAFFGQVPHYSVTEKRRLMVRTGVTPSMGPGDWTLFWAGLDADAKTTLADTAACYDLIRAMTMVCTLPDILLRYGELASFPILHKLQYLKAAAKIASLSVAQWETMVVFANPQHMLDMRGNAVAYHDFLEFAPTSLFGGHDWVQCLLTGAAGVNAAQLKRGLLQLNDDQKTVLRGSNANMQTVVDGLGGVANDIFEVLINLGLEPKWIIYWLDKAGVVAAATAAQWGQIVGEATNDEMAEIDGWADVKTLYETHCPENIRTTRASLPADEADLAGTLTSARIRELFTTLSPAGFLGAMASDATTAAENYQKVDDGNRLLRTIRGLARGTAMGGRAHENLKTWFMDCGEARLNVIEAMFEARFNIDVKANRAQRVQHADATTRVRRWTVEGLKESWPQFELLPPDQVENNNSLDNFFRNRRQGNGNAYYWQNSVVMGLKSGDDLTQQSDADVYGVGGQYGEVDPITGNPINQSPQVQSTVWNATIRHEIGHAVDDNLGVMTRWQSSPQCGNWTKHATAANFVQSIINDYGGLGTAVAPNWGIPAADFPYYQAAMAAAVTSGITLTAALTAECTARGAPAPTLPVPDAGPMQAVFLPARCTPASNGPWYGNDWATTAAGRNYHRAYGDNTSLYSFVAATRANKLVSQYQWRAPGEWFAEAYQVYYVEQESDPNAAVGGVLRSKDPQAANLVANFVDRGYSPQEMRGGARRDTPQRVDAPGGTGP